jgi:membrane protein implicated in regulation of membrane protease activity
VTVELPRVPVEVVAAAVAVAAVALLVAVDVAVELSVAAVSLMTDLALHTRGLEAFQGNNWDRGHSLAGETCVVEEDEIPLVHRREEVDIDNWDILVVEVDTEAALEDRQVTVVGAVEEQ